MLQLPRMRVAACAKNGQSRQEDDRHTKWLVLTVGWLCAGREESPRSASFANGCGVDSWCLDRRQCIGEHTRPVVVDALGALEVVRPAVAPELSRCNR